MLMHILDPKQPGLLARVLADVDKAATTTSDGGVDLDIRKLASSPLLQSIFHETLRMYTDVLVTRDLHQDVTLPIGDSKDSPRRLLLKKGTSVFAPSLVNHWDPNHFASPPADVFCAERFLVPAGAEKEGGGGGGGGGEVAFSTEADGRRIFPWGGGPTICPGRVFAKQEVMSAVALTLLTFDIVPVDEKSYRIPRPAQAPPGTGGVVPGGDVKVWLQPRAYVKT